MDAAVVFQQGDLPLHQIGERDRLLMSVHLFLMSIDDFQTFSYCQFTSSPFLLFCCPFSVTRRITRRASNEGGVPATSLTVS
jgi:hypothetical protein